MVPVLYCMCIMCILGATFGVFVLLRLWQYRVAKRPFRAQGREPHDEEEVRSVSALSALCHRIVACRNSF